MPNFNLFPLCGDYGTPTNTDSTTNKVMFGEGGTIQRGLKGLNPLRQTRTITSNTSNFTDVDSFIVANQGKPMRLRFEGLTSDDGKLYRLINYSWTYRSTEIRGFNGEFKEVKLSSYVFDTNFILFDELFIITESGGKIIA